MIRINENYLLLQSNYLFKEIEHRVADVIKKNPDISIINLGIGDVTNPLPPVAIDALHRASTEMGSEVGFRGYGPSEGYEFLRTAIAQTDYLSRDIKISADEIFVSDGAKCDTSNFQELFSKDIAIAVQDPIYPVYIESNVMAGRSGQWKDGYYQNIHYLPADESNGFIPALPETPVDLIYLCFPNNPTGAVASRKQLQSYVDYARENRALILFDAAYVAFIRDDDVPRSIFEIEGSRECAVEFRSLSKTAGFTGLRCAYTVIPKECVAWDNSGKQHSVAELWRRRQNTRFNGLAYPVQRAAEAVFSPDGQTQIRELCDEYLKNAVILIAALDELGFSCYGGKNAPYIWAKTTMPSWDCFDLFLEEGQVSVTPGEGFGAAGEYYIRISAFNSRKVVFNAIEKIRKVVKQNEGRFQG